MAKKKLKGLEKKVDRLAQKTLEAPSYYDLQKFCDSTERTGNSYRSTIDFDAYGPTDYGVVMMQCMYADPNWFYTDGCYVPDFKAYIGDFSNCSDIYTCNTRAFARWMVEEIEEHRISELKSIYSAAITNEYMKQDEETGKYIKHGVDYDCAILTWFTNGEVHELYLTNTPEVDIVKAFISKISEILRTINNRKDMPEENAFQELISKLKTLEKAPLTYVHFG